MAKCYCTRVWGSHDSAECQGLPNGAARAPAEHYEFLQRFRKVNVARAEKWHESDNGMRGWSPAEWSNALAGEVGELCNITKKILRADHGLDQSNPVPRGTLMYQAADEIADVAIYLDLVAARLGFDLQECITRKFNRTSEKMGFEEKL